MAAGPSIDVTGWLEEQLAQASPDLLRSVVQTFAEALMAAEAAAVCGAGYGERSDQRTNTRNGYRRREWDTLIRLVGAVLAEQHDEWTEMRRYIGLDILAKSRTASTATSAAEEVTLTAITA